MAYKSFLTFLAPEDPNEVLDGIIELVRTSDGHLDIIVLGVLNSPPIAIHDFTPATEWAQVNKEIADAAVARVAEVEAYVAESGISASVDVDCDYAGNLEKIAARYALCTDLHVVLNNSFNSHECVKKAFNGTLFDAGCPVLLLPETESNLAEMSKVVIAWNGRAEASHAIRYAMPILKNAERVNIVVVDPVDLYVGQDPGSDLAAHLSRHGIHITVDVLASGGMTVQEKLMQRAKDVNADLVVMGGYGHTKLREWLLGGTTYETLGQSELPIFMVH